jgi:hypothetical protein
MESNACWGRYYFKFSRTNNVFAIRGSFNWLSDHYTVGGDGYSLWQYVTDLENSSDIGTLIKIWFVDADHLVRTTVYSEDDEDDLDWVHLLRRLAPVYASELFPKNIT